MAPLIGIAYEDGFGPAWLKWRRVDNALDLMNFTRTWLRSKGHAITRVVVAFL